jgi:Domain of unknown function (DUF6429)
MNAAGQDAGTQGGKLSKSEEVAHDLSLMLMFLSSWIERPGDAPRFWKGFDFEVLNHLVAEGLISDSRRAKSAYLTEDGVRRARELLAQYGLSTAESA